MSFNCLEKTYFKYCHITKIH